MEKKWCSFKEIVQQREWLLAGTWGLCALCSSLGRSVWERSQKRGGKSACSHHSSSAVVLTVGLVPLWLWGRWGRLNLQNYCWVGQCWPQSEAKLCLCGLVLVRKHCWKMLEEREIGCVGSGGAGWAFCRDVVTWLFNSQSPVWSLVAQGTQKHCLPRWICFNAEENWFTWPQDGNRRANLWRFSAAPDGNGCCAAWTADAYKIKNSIAGEKGAVQWVCKMCVCLFKWYFFSKSLKYRMPFLNVFHWFTQSPGITLPAFSWSL